MIGSSLLVAVLLTAEAAFPLRTEATPKEWKPAEINDGLPYRWEPGEVHVLAWEVIEDDRPWKVTQALVLKRFDKPTEKGGHRWVLAQVYQQTRDAERPWATPFSPAAPVSEGGGWSAALGRAHVRLRVLRQAAERCADREVPGRNALDAAAGEREDRDGRRHADSDHHADRRRRRPRAVEEAAGAGREGGTAPRAEAAGSGEEVGGAGVESTGVCRGLRESCRKLPRLRRRLRELAASFCAVGASYWVRCPHVGHNFRSRSSLTPIFWLVKSACFR